MTAQEFRRALAQLDLTIYGAADALGIGMSSAYGYARGNRPIPEKIAITVRALVKLKSLGEEAAKDVGR
jgi:hypothetical protein